MQMTLFAILTVQMLYHCAVIIDVHVAAPKSHVAQEDMYSLIWLATI